MPNAPELRDFTFVPSGGMWCVTAMERDAIIEDLALMSAVIKQYEAQAKLINGR